jgi:hypothetical protein
VRSTITARSNSAAAARSVSVSSETASGSGRTLEALRDRDEDDAGGAEPTDVRQEVERGAPPAIEALHEHHVDGSALCRVHHAFHPGSKAAATRGSLLDIDHDAQTARRGGGTQLGARQARVLLAGRDPMVERGAKGSAGMRRASTAARFSPACRVPVKAFGGGQTVIHLAAI